MSEDTWTLGVLSPPASDLVVVPSDISLIEAIAGVDSAGITVVNVNQLLGAPIGPANAVPMYDAYLSPVTTAWTSATALNTAFVVNTSGYDTVIFTAVGGATVTGGAITFEVYDGANWLPLKAARTDSYLTDSVFTLSANFSKAWQLSVAGFPQARARLSTALTGAGSLGLTMAVSSAPDTSLVTVGFDPSSPLPAGTNALGTVIAELSAPQATADQASAAITATTTSAAVTPTFGAEYEVNQVVTAVTGTSPTMDVVVEESEDGTNWFDVYHFSRITAAGAYRSPKLIMKGTRLRVVETIGGTTPSFTRSRNRLQGSSGMAQFTRRIFDRAISLTTLSATTTTTSGNALNVQDCRNLSLTINIGAATTAPALQLQASEDGGASWFLIGSPLLAVASSTVSMTLTNVNYELVRAIVTTAGATVTPGYVAIKGF